MNEYPNNRAPKRDTPIDVALVDGAARLGRRSLIKIGAGLLAGLAAACKGGGGLPPSPADRVPLPRWDPTRAGPGFVLCTSSSSGWGEVGNPEAKLSELETAWKKGWEDGALRLRWRDDAWEEVLPPDTMAELMRLHAKDEAPR